MIFRPAIVKFPDNFDFKRDKDKLNKLLENMAEKVDFILFAEIYNRNYPEVVDIYSPYAEEYSIYISPGLMLERDNDSMYRSSFLINPEGKIILKQRQLYISEKDRLVQSTQKINSDKKHNEFKTGKSINYVRTEYGQIAFMLGSDCWHPRVGRVMRLEGTDIVLSINNLNNTGKYNPLDNSGSYNPWQQLSGVWSQVQQNQFLALEASIGGRSLIHAPCEITPGRTGILAPALSVENEEYQAVNKDSINDFFESIRSNYIIDEDFEYILTEIDIDKLGDIRNSYPLIKYLNNSLYCQEMGCS